MDNRNGFSDSNEISNNSSTCCIAAANTETLSTSETLKSNISALRNLSVNLEAIFESSDFDFFSDAKIVMSTGREIPVHRCILSARSAFLKNVLTGKERVAKFEVKELVRDYDVGFDSLVAVLGYLYGGKVKTLPKGVCVCVDDDCSHVACRPAVDFMVEVIYVSFTFQVPEFVALYQRNLLDILDKVAADDVLVALFVASMCGKACEKLLERCIEIIVKSNVDIVALDKALPQHVVKNIMDLHVERNLERPESLRFPDKHVKRIHRALDSDDVELVRMLLKEAHTNLDDAHALHYAVAYCDAKTTAKLLDLGLADVNHRNSRGYTVLHVAAMRKEPKIIVSLLTKGAKPADLTLDGRRALQISKQLIRAADYYTPIEEGKPSPKGCLCIEILEQAERRDPLLGKASLYLAMPGDDLRMKLLYLENREFTFSGGFKTKTMVGAQRTTMDLNEAPFRIQEEHLTRMKALSRTVELGKCFFPHCSEVLNKIMDADDLTLLACVGNDTPKERLLKRKRYMELQEVLSKAFIEDKEEFDRSAVSSSSSSKSVGLVWPTADKTH